ncbi:MAG TPA: hypothetical protein VFB32_08560 [Rudaea sp.]|nr:hypothetical protein [Rudaea sp.]
MKKAILAVACSVGIALMASAAPVFAAQAFRTHFVVEPAEGSALQAGDTLVANGQGQVALYRGHELVAVIQDPNDIAAEASAARPLYLVDQDGAIIRGDLRDYDGDIYLSHSAPIVPFYRSDRPQVPMADAGKELKGGAPEPLNPSSPQFNACNPSRPTVRSCYGYGGAMTLHNGNVMVTPTIEAVFWGSWSQSDPIIAGMDKFFQGWSGSSIANASDEYHGTTNGYVTGSANYAGHVFDTSSTGNSTPSSSTMVSKACSLTGNNPNPNALYTYITSNWPGGQACGFHTWGTCSNGAQVQVAWIGNFTGTTGCGPGASSGNSQGLADIASVTSHEVSEATTDPRGTGWFDNGGYENGDKCEWVYAAMTLANGANFSLQREWSNSLYAAGTGFANYFGQKGCKQ